MRKAQIDIIGLVIIVILIITVAVFVIRFLSSKETADFKGEYTQKELASNMLSTFLATTSDCNGLTMTELLQDCGQNPDNRICSGNSQSTCSYVEQAAIEIFGKTLELWDLGYEFKAYLDEANPIISLGQSCPGDKRSQVFPLPTSLGTLYVKLDICS